MKPYIMEQMVGVMCDDGDVLCVVMVLVCVRVCARACVCWDGVCVGVVCGDGVVFCDVLLCVMLACVLLWIIWRQVLTMLITDIIALILITLSQNCAHSDPCIHVYKPSSTLNSSTQTHTFPYP